jgi:hypothetical protein
VFIGLKSMNCASSRRWPFELEPEAEMLLSAAAAFGGSCQRFGFVAIQGIQTNVYSSSTRKKIDRIKEKSSLSFSFALSFVVLALDQGGRHRWWKGGHVGRKVGKRQGSSPISKRGRETRDLVGDAF